MSEALADLQPSRLWQHFSAIAAIPRSSRNERALSRYVIEVAQRAGCMVRRDRGGRLLIKCQATPGYELVPSLCLQSHLDASKNSIEDEILDPIYAESPLQRQGNAIRTTPRSLVAADQGITLAAMLALIEEGTAAHGPLEFLLTLEEDGNTSSYKEMDPQMVESQWLLNLDGGEEGTLTIGSSGTRETIGHWKPLWEEIYDKDPSGILRIEGLSGGQASFDLDKYGGNAIKLLARVLLPLHDKGVRISSLQGGGRRNSIPREAEAYIYIPHKRLPEIQELIARLEATVSLELKDTDPDFKLSFHLHSFKKGKVLKRVQVRRILHVIHAMPHGVLRMNPLASGLVQTSTHISGLSTARRQLSLVSLQRSLSASELDACASSIVSLLDIGGADIEQSEVQLAWKPQLDSEFLQLAERSFEQIYRRKPILKTMQSGTGELDEKFTDREMLSFGAPLIDRAASDGQLDIASVERYWHYLSDMVQALGQRDSKASLH